MGTKSPRTPSAGGKKAKTTPKASPGGHSDRRLPTSPSTSQQKTSQKKKRKQPQGGKKRVDEKQAKSNEKISQDGRFSKVLSDPRFRREKKDSLKLTIDKRFKGVFEDDRFKSTHTVDKYGRKVGPSKMDDMKKFYKMDDDSERDNDDDADDDVPSEDEDNESDEGEDEDNRFKMTKTMKKEKKASTKAPTSDENQDEDDDDDEEEKEEEEEGFDGARFGGRGLGDTNWEEFGSSSEDEEDDEDGDRRVVYIGDEGEQDEVIESEDVSNRLAVVGCDWDQIKAVDLLAVLQSMCPAIGTILSVAIYPSDYGIERIAEEDRRGPAIMWNNSKNQEDGIDDGGDDGDDDASGDDVGDSESESDADDSDSSDDDVDVDVYEELREYCRKQGKGGIVTAGDMGEDFDEDELRDYQRSRLKYYFAIVKCDTINTATALYRECDGIELAHTSNELDLRFVPDDTSFEDRSPREVCTGVPSTYHMPAWYTKSLQHTSMKLTWDADDVERETCLRRRAFTSDDLESMDLNTYIASSSDDDSSDDEDREWDGGFEKSDLSESEQRKMRKEKKKEMVRQRYAKLLGDDSDSEGDDGEDGDMEISFTPGLSNKVSEVLQRNKEKVERKDETVWDRKNRERKEAGKAKRLAKQSALEDEDMYDDGGADRRRGDRGDDFSDAESDIDSEDEDKKQADLELLMMGEDFGEEGNSKKRKRSDETTTATTNEKKDSYKERRKERGKKRRRKGGKASEAEAQGEKDAEMVDTADDRFSALFDSHHYNIDPTHPEFSKAKSAAKKIAQEKLLRKNNNSNNNNADGKKKKTTSSTTKSNKGSTLSKPSQSGSNDGDSSSALARSLKARNAPAAAAPPAGFTKGKKTMTKKGGRGGGGVSHPKKHAGNGKKKSGKSQRREAL
eukprot:TRINITY_DN2837_c2_g1_i2.p1 TRINITY_DN2837_c2_g1~~TRINITY_DN2837_c2_g1_i2.p1  ORF type:complete len:902 (-),score=391.39 TRINITY_DN2837_c2_g1_i2:8-2713(-)